MLVAQLAVCQFDLDSEHPLLNLVLIVELSESVDCNRALGESQIKFGYPPFKAPMNLKPQTLGTH